MEFVDRMLTLRNGVEMPKIGLGTFRSSPEEINLAVTTALQMGIMHIDTASIYKNQEAIGQAIKDTKTPRSKVFVTSKISPYQQGRQKAYAACVDILEKLDLGYVDLVLVHWPGASKTPPDSELNSTLRAETWQVMEEFHRQGKFKSIGVSNYEERHIQELLNHASVPPAVNQFEVHPRRPCTALRKACSSAGIQVVAYASMGAGQLLESQKVITTAHAINRSPAQVLLRWGLLKGCAVIPKSVRPERISGFSEAALLDGWSAEEDEEVLKLDSLEDGHKYCWDPSDIR
ncbi:hypothetical protein CEUSTIGMA_g8927.t1 [Chlamydomonas eustigma]|uniref:NADP-dependent oxidoreductase domain-containing protein n=1 Tax=Chlamydomonas eustigma TaxID=1157962 RepID=A0A250XF05_9CHLO|nr:hypothetical protein CEUSTIGMA_g8927.t1 [Chlamydomonas eustigma]|eukprot:GAX81499.1 hypothetical protein CEUSTIGMA_g8927.t1 [Chlamydomonas eustigma]